MTTSCWENIWEEYQHSAKANPAQNYRRELIHFLIGDDFPARIVDAGCGTGELLASLHQHYPSAELLGLELSATGIEAAKAIAPQAHYWQTDLTEPQEVPEPFAGWATHATCSEVLEHLAKPDQFLKELRKYLAPGGKLIVTVPSGPMSEFDRFLGHQQHFSQESLAQLLRDAGFHRVTVLRAGFPFFNLYRCLVVLRGKKLIQDARAKNNHWLFRLFRVLFRMNLRRSQWGWQLIASANG